MRRFYYLFIFLSFIALAGCARFVEIINEGSNPYYYQPGIAVIVVGGIGESRLSSLKAVTYQGVRDFEVPPGASRRIDAFAWKIKVGDSFRLFSVDMGTAMKGGEFPNSHTIMLEKEGIYYYGTILSKSEHVLLIRKALPEIITVANDKYPYVFNALDPINFE